MESAAWYVSRWLPFTFAAKCGTCSFKLINLYNSVSLSCLPKFRSFDKDGDGFLTPVELVNRLKKGGLHLNDVEVAQLMIELDPNNDMSISYG